MGVDYYYCKSCKECFHYDRFPCCCICEKDIGDCKYCVDEELCIFDEQCDIFEVICNKCIIDTSINDIIETLEENQLKLSKERMLEQINVMKQNINENILIERELNDIEIEIKLLTKRKKELTKKLNTLKK